MNDRFKFRAWDINSKKYLYDFYIMATEGKIIYSSAENEDDVIIEQCTGLKDKHGKLIYEGDFIKDDEGFVGLVKYDEVCAMFQIEFINSAPSNFENDMSREFEVIGNIHENPELGEEEE